MSFSYSSLQSRILRPVCEVIQEKRKKSIACPIHFSSSFLPASLLAPLFILSIWIQKNRTLVSSGNLFNWLTMIILPDKNLKMNAWRHRDTFCFVIFRKCNFSSCSNLNFWCFIHLWYILCTRKIMCGCLVIVS